MNTSEKTLAELAQGATAIAKCSCSACRDFCGGEICPVCGDKLINILACYRHNLIFCLFGMMGSRWCLETKKIGSEVLAIPASELKQLLGEADNG